MKRLMILILTLLTLSALTIAGSVSAQHRNRDASPMASPMAMHRGSGTSAAYLTITNNGDESDTLIGGSTDVAEIVEIHDMKIDNDVMRMFQLPDGLEIPAGETVELKPQSLHVMLINLTRDLHPGDTFDLTLVFEKAGEVTLTLTTGFEAPEHGAEATVGDLVITGAWARSAPMLDAGMEMGTPDASPMAEN